MHIFRARHAFSTIKTRFLHRLDYQPTILHLRNYLYSYLFVKSNKGIMEILFDQASLKDPQKNMDVFMQQLSWMQIGPGEDISSPVLMDKYRPRYVKYLKHLVDNNRVYLCFCQHRVKDYDGKCRDLPFEKTKQFLEQKKPYRVRLKRLDLEFTYEDLVYGTVTSNPREDPVIQDPASGMSTQFKAVIADQQLNVTHVFHNSQNSKQLDQYLTISKVLELTLPTVITLPPISEHHVRSLPIEQLKDDQYQPQAVVNFTALLGWRPFGDSVQNASSLSDDYLFQKEDLIKYFQVDKITKQPAHYHLDKLRLLNKLYMKKNLKQDSSVSEFRARLNSLFGEDKVSKFDDQQLGKVLGIISKSIRKWSQLSDFGFLFSSQFPKKKPSIQRDLQIKINNNLVLILKHIISPEDFSPIEFAQKISQFLQDHRRQIAPEVCYKYLKYCISGQPNLRPSAVQLCGVLGHKEVLNRLLACRQDFTSDVSVY